MRKTARLMMALGLLLSLFSLLIVAVSAQEAPPPASTEEAMSAEDALVERGEYLIHMTGCISCHTPYQEAYQDFTQLTPDQLKTMSMATLETLDLENAMLAGGRPFDLGPMGVVFSANLTPDEETGIGSWSDAEIETALRVGINPDGRRLHPLMPYRNYFMLAESDLDAIIAYLRSVPAVSNEVDRSGPSGEGFEPELIAEELFETPPDGSDPVELGAYLVNTIMSCGDCHTPLDPTTGMPLFDQWLAGGQPWEGPWGIVYGGNITPHEERGIGAWTDEDIERVFREGVRIDGRRVVLMPWEDYAVATDEDLAAVIAYLRSLPAVDLEVPAPALNDFIIEYAD